jgi:hypothetical protein
VERGREDHEGAQVRGDADGPLWLVAGGGSDDNDTLHALGVSGLVERQQRGQGVFSRARVDQVDAGEVPARGAQTELEQGAIRRGEHFQLTARLWSALKRARGARVVALSSRGHARAAFDFDDPKFERRPYDKWVAYGHRRLIRAPQLKVALAVSAERVLFC